MKVYCHDSFQLFDTRAPAFCTTIIYYYTANKKLIKFCFTNATTNKGIIITVYFKNQRFCVIIIGKRLRHITAAGLYAIYLKALRPVLYHSHNYAVDS